ncbi:MAG: GNAT family N-acetyltransferase [Actinomycetota bacterium]|nr:GNAT family N-acetyltransferase [Actinomycetota bacterium]
MARVRRRVQQRHAGLPAGAKDLDERGRRDQLGRSACGTRDTLDVARRRPPQQLRAPTHPDCSVRGFGRALLQEGLRRFAAAGMTYAIVGVDADNPGAEALYRSVGFRPDRLLRVYARP